MRVLIVSNMYPSKQKAYAGIFVKNQFDELKRVFSEEDRLDIFYMERAFTSKLGSFIKYLRAGVKFIPFLFKKYDVVHLHFFFPLIILVWFYKKLHPKTKVIVTFHGSDINSRVNEKNQWYYKKLAKCVDFAIPVGEELSLTVESKLGLKTGKVLSAGVDSKVFYKMPEEPKVYDCIFVGSFFEVKGIDLLLQAIKALPKTFSFCIVGKGIKYETLIHQMRKDGYKITLMIDKTQDDLRLLFNQSRFLVQPSREEGFGLVAAEAMFCGVPVIVSRVGGFKEQVIHDRNGYFFDKENIKQLYNLLLKTKEMPISKYENLQQCALDSSKKLSLQQVCKELMLIYKSLSL